jgi:hydroxymethylpyrimidine pyrophosphatase-like HAD family hydrolase
MIRLFVTDIDGCLAVPYRPFRLDRLSRIRDWARLAGAPGSHDVYPAVSICSGRSYPYVEAMSQILDLRTPVLFESGAGLFDPVEMLCRWHPDVAPDLESGMEEVKRFVSRLAAGTAVSVDLSKRTQVAVVAPDRKHIDPLIGPVSEFVSVSHPALKTFVTPFSIDVVAPNLTKRDGIRWLAEICGVGLDEIAFVGDTDGDIGALQLVGSSFAPANADTSVRAVVGETMSGSDVDGVIEAYEKVLTRNREANPEAKRPLER